MHDHLGRHVEQLGDGRVAAQVGEDMARVAGGGRRAQVRRGDAAHPRLGVAPRPHEAAHLVLDQREQGAHHDGDAGGKYSGELVAQALATARRKQDEAVVARDGGFDGLVLHRPQGRVSKDESCRGLNL